MGSVFSPPKTCRVAFGFATKFLAAVSASLLTSATCMVPLTTLMALCAEGPHNRTCDKRRLASILRRELVGRPDSAHRHRKHIEAHPRASSSMQELQSITYISADFCLRQEDHLVRFGEVVWTTQALSPAASRNASHGCKIDAFESARAQVPGGRAKELSVAEAGRVKPPSSVKRKKYPGGSGKRLGGQHTTGKSE